MQHSRFVSRLAREVCPEALSGSPCHERSDLSPLIAEARSEGYRAGSKIMTDAPKDNQGKGESFSPTDLVATAMGSCMLTIMGIAARNFKIDISGATVRVQKEMVIAPVRRTHSPFI